MRLLNATDSNGDMVDITRTCTTVQWATYPNETITQYVHQEEPSSCWHDVPAGAAWMFLEFEQIADLNMVTPFWVEWLLSPRSV